MFKLFWLYFIFGFTSVSFRVKLSLENVRRYSTSAQEGSQTRVLGI